MLSPGLSGGLNKYGHFCRQSPWLYQSALRYLASLRAVPGRERRTWPEAKEADGPEGWVPRRLDMDTSFG